MKKALILAGAALIFSLVTSFASAGIVANVDISEQKMRGYSNGKHI